MSFLKKITKNIVKFDKGVFGGGYARKGLKAAAKFAKSNPQLVSEAAGFVPGGGFLSGFLGGTPPTVDAPAGADTGATTAPPMSTGTILAIGAGLVVLVLVLRKKR